VSRSISTTGYKPAELARPGAGRVRGRLPRPGSCARLAADSSLTKYLRLAKYAQVIGKAKLALTPFLNEWWNVALTLTCRSMTTGPMPSGPADLQIRRPGHG
jgi:hypothetical protein